MPLSQPLDPPYVCGEDKRRANLQHVLQMLKVREKTIKKYRSSWPVVNERHQPGLLSVIHP